MIEPSLASEIEKKKLLKKLWKKTNSNREQNNIHLIRIPQNHKGQQK